MPKVLVVTSGKGGVGKTTSTAAMGAALAQAGQKVAVVDFDAMRNLSIATNASDTSRKATKTVCSYSARVPSQSARAAS